MENQLPEAMTAVEISEPGGPEVLKPVTLPLPKPGGGEVLIRVDHAGVNRPDCLQRAGAYPPPKGASPLPGLEARLSALPLWTADELRAVERFEVGPAADEPALSALLATHC